MVNTRIQIRRESEEINRQRHAALSAEAVSFIETFLAGRDDPDGKLVSAAALKWARGDGADSGQSGEESEVPHRLASRDRYWAALNAYARATDSKKKAENL